MASFDYYRTLGIDRSASQSEIRSRFRELAKQYHPDVNKNPSAEEEFKKISTAYDILGDENKRKNYDLGIADNYSSRFRSDINQNFQRMIKREMIRLLIETKDFEGIGRASLHFDENDWIFGFDIMKSKMFSSVKKANLDDLVHNIATAMSFAGIYKPGKMEEAYNSIFDKEFKSKLIKTAYANLEEYILADQPGPNLSNSYVLTLSSLSSLSTILGYEDKQACEEAMNIVNHAARKKYLDHLAKATTLKLETAHRDSLIELQIIKAIRSLEQIVYVSKVLKESTTAPLSQIFYDGRESLLQAYALENSQAVKRQYIRLAGYFASHGVEEASNIKKQFSKVYRAENPNAFRKIITKINNLFDIKKMMGQSIAND